jgi:hypothetical protein
MEEYLKFNVIRRVEKYYVPLVFRNNPTCQTQQLHPTVN